MSYKGKSSNTAVASTINNSIVKSSASATATSNHSQKDANKKANKLANKLAKQSAKYTASIINQSVLEKNIQPLYSTIFLLETTHYTADNYTKQTLNYYWNEYPLDFNKYIIISSDIDINTGNNLTDNNNIIENNIAYLDKYYKLGCRVFIGMSRSTILSGVLPWFNLHPDVIGISLSSSSISLNIPKSIYRLQSPDSVMIDSINIQLINATKIYYIYSDPEDASLSLLNYLISLYGTNKIITFPVDTNSKLTKTNIQTYFSDFTNTDISIMYLFNGTEQETYINLFDSNYCLPIITYDIANSGIPLINTTTQVAIVNKYNYLSYQSLSTSKFFNEGLTNMGSSFINMVPNCLLMINNKSNNLTINNLNTISSHNSVLQFNQNNDLKYYSLLNQIYKFSNSSYSLINSFMYFNDPIIGSYTLIL